MKEVSRIKIEGASGYCPYEEAYNDTKYDEEQLEKIDSDISKKQQ